VSVSFRPKSITVVKSAGYAWAEYAPHPALAAWVGSYWTFQTDPGRHVIRTLPDGCVDLTVRLGSTPRAFLTGTHRRPRSWTLRGRVHHVGARLLPGAAALLGIDAGALSEEWTPLDRRLPRWIVGRLVRDIAQAGTAPARVVVLDAFFSERLLNRGLDPRLSRALQQIFAHQGDIPVASLARHAGAHARTLGRLFDRAIGLSPKRFVRVVRLQAALRALPDADSWAHVAVDLGYHDQAHFIHDVRELFGATPGDLVAMRERTC
jgi:AraC-like DNA-binding protein